MRGPSSMDRGGPVKADISTDFPNAEVQEKATELS